MRDVSIMLFSSTVFSGSSGTVTVRAPKNTSAIHAAIVVVFACLSKSILASIEMLDEELFVGEGNWRVRSRC